MLKLLLAHVLGFLQLLSLFVSPVLLQFRSSPSQFTVPAPSSDY